MVTGYNNPNIDWCFGGHPGIFMSLGRDISFGASPSSLGRDIPPGAFPLGEISLPSDMNMTQHQSIFGRYS